MATAYTAGPLFFFISLTQFKQTRTFSFVNPLSGSNILCEVPECENKKRFLSGQKRKVGIYYLDSELTVAATTIPAIPTVVWSKGCREGLVASQASFAFLPLL